MGKRYEWMGRFFGGGGCTPGPLQKTSTRFRALLSLAFSLFLGGLTSGAQVNVLTHHNDIGRSGQNLNETILTPTNVNATQFGKLFSHSVNGALYAQPLYVSQLAIPGSGKHNVVFAVTSNDWVYAFDADSNTGANSGPLWAVSLLTNTTPVGTYTSQWGVLSTPVIDLPSKTIFLVSSEIQGSTYLYRLHALDITTGAEKAGGPYQIQASVPGTGSGSTGGVLAFDAYYERQRPALLLVNGVLYIGFGSNGDLGPWHGWIFSFNQSTLQPIDVYCTTPNGVGAGIWLSAGGMAAEVNDSTKPFGRMFVVNGNGSFSASSPYTNTMSYGMSVENLDLTNGKMTVTDEFSPHNRAFLDGQDADLGSGAAILLPTQTLPGGKTLNPLVADGKSGTIYILDRNNLGGYNTTADNIVQEVQTPEFPGSGNNWGWGLYGTQAYWNGNIYIGGTNPASAIPLAAYSFTGGQLSTTPTSQSASSFLFPGPTPSVSANGTTNGIVWAIQAHSSPGILLAYDATNLQNLLYSSNTNLARDNPGPSVIFSTPTIANGKVYVGGGDDLSVYGLNPPAATVNPLTVTVANASTTSGAATLPLFTSTVSGLVNGDQLGTNIIINYSTTATPESLPGTYPITATVAGPSAYTYQPVINAGTLTIAPPAATPYFPGGFTNVQQLVLNAGATLSGSRLRLTDGGANEARSAFFNTPLNVQQFSTSFDFQLTNANADGFTFTVQGVGATVVGGGGGNLGYTNIAKSVAVKFDLYSNSGEGANSTGLYINGVAPTLPATDLSASGINLHSGDTFNAQISYDGSILTVVLIDRLTRASATQTYNVNIPLVVGGPVAFVGFTAASGGKTATQDILNWTYSASETYQTLSSAALSLNGNSFLFPYAAKLRLTDGGVNEVSTTFFTAPVNVQQFTTSFNFQITNPVADGFTFTIQGDGPKALGIGGGNLGFTGLAKSVAVKFDLYNNAGEGINSTGLYTNGTAPMASATDLSSAGLDLHSGDVFNALLVYNGATLTVVLTDTVTNATATQTYTIDIPAIVGGSTAYAGFTGASGGKTAIQDILNWTYTTPKGNQPLYPQGFSAPQLALNGGAALNGLRLQLTDGGANEARSAFFKTPVGVQTFTSSFDFQITNPNADGFTFTIQADGPTVLGIGGASLGYGTINDSVAVKFDIHSNEGEGANSTGLFIDGATPTVPSVNLSSTKISLHSGDIINAQFTYDGSLLTVVLTDTVTNATAVQTYSVDIPSAVGASTAYVGFTGASGGNVAIQEIVDWVYLGSATM